MTTIEQPPESARVRAAIAIRDAVLASMDVTSSNPFQFGDDEIPDVADATQVAAVALFALCTVVQVTGLRADRVRHIFDIVINDERWR